MPAPRGRRKTPAGNRALALCHMGLTDRRLTTYQMHTKQAPFGYQIATQWEGIRNWIVSLVTLAAIAPITMIATSPILAWISWTDVD